MGSRVRLGDDAARRRNARGARRSASRCASSPRTARPICCSSTPSSAVARPRGDHRRRRRRGAPARHDRREDPLPVLGVPVRVAGAATAWTRCCRSCRCRAGIPVGDLRHRQGRRRQRGAVRRRRSSRNKTRAIAAALDSIPRRADRAGARTPDPRETRCQRAALRRTVPMTQASRHPRRRAARPHARACRRSARLRLPVARHRRPMPARRQVARRRARRTRRRRRARASSPRASTSRRSSSRTCPRPRRVARPNASPVFPPPRALARRAGSPGRENAVPRARHPDAARSPPIDCARRRSTRRARDRHARRPQDAPPGLRRQGPGASSTARRRSRGAGRELGRAPSILEAFVPFEREVSVVAVRGARRRVPHLAADRELAPRRHPARRASRRRRRRRAADASGAWLARDRWRARLRRRVRARVVPPEDGLLANEMAPRVHNSGHWTIEGARDEPVREPPARGARLAARRHAHARPRRMLNWIGALPAARRGARDPGAHWHDYGKEPAAGPQGGPLHARGRGSRPGLLERFRALREAVTVGSKQ